MSDHERFARALVEAAGFPAGEVELAQIAARYATMRAMAAELRGVPGAHREEPELLPDLREPPADPTAGG